jgi:hypothetical protein
LPAFQQFAQVAEMAVTVLKRVVSRASVAIELGLEVVPERVLAAGAELSGAKPADDGPGLRIAVEAMKLT